MTGGFSIFLIYLIAAFAIGAFLIVYLTLNLFVKLAIELLRIAVVKALHGAAAALTMARRKQPC